MTRRRAIALVAVWTLPSLLFLAWTWHVYARWRIDVPPRLDAEARVAVVASLRDALDRGVVTTPEHPALARRLAHGGPVAARLWLDGLELAHIEGRGDTVALATRAAAEQLSVHAAAKLRPEQRARLRIQVDVVVGRGPIDRQQWPLTLVALHPGIEGLAVTVRGDELVPREVMLMPDEMFYRGLLEKKRFFPAMPDIGMGVELARADRLLTEAAAIHPPKSLSRRR